MRARITKLLLLFSGVMLSLSLAAQYPSNPAKSRLGYQTTGDGLIFRGAGAPAYSPGTLFNAWTYLDTTNMILYGYKNFSWVRLPSANNGLTMSGAYAQLGGSLNQNTTVESGTYNLKLGKTSGTNYAYMNTYSSGVRAGMYSIYGAIETDFAIGGGNYNLTSNDLDDTNQFTFDPNGFDFTYIGGSGVSRFTMDSARFYMYGLPSFESHAAATTGIGWNGLYRLTDKRAIYINNGTANDLGMPFDSITFNSRLTEPATRELKYSTDYETLVFGAGGTTIEIGQKEAWYVKNQTGSTIAKGTVVRAAGTLGSSGRILVAPMISDGTISSKYLLGITASSIANGADGYVIHFGKLRKTNTNSWNEGDVLYASATTPGALTNVEPAPPNLRLPIAFVVNKSATNGVLAVRIQTGNELHELHDVDTSGINTGEGLVYNSTSNKWQSSAGKLITTVDTAGMLANYPSTAGWGILKSTKTIRADSAKVASRFFVNSNFFPLQGGTLTGTGGAGFVGFPSQITAPGTPASGLNVYAQGSSFNWKGTDGYERQFASTLTGGRTYTLPNASGTFALGTGTSTRIPIWTSANALGDSPALYNSTTKRWTWDSPSVIELPMGTDAQRPSPATTSDFWYSMTSGGLEWYNGTRWAKALESTANKFTAGSLIFADANGQATQDNASLFWNSSTKRLGIGTTSPSQVVEIYSTTASVDLLKLQTSFHSAANLKFSLSNYDAKILAGNALYLEATVGNRPKTLYGTNEVTTSFTTTSTLNNINLRANTLIEGLFGFYFTSNRERKYYALQRDLSYAGGFNVGLNLATYDSYNSLSTFDKGIVQFKLSPSKEVWVGDQTVNTNYNFYVTQPQTGSGSINCTSGSSTITGTASFFTKDFSVGTSITINAVTFTIASITNETTATVTPTPGFSGTYDYIINNSTPIRFGVYKNGGVEINQATAQTRYELQVTGTGGIGLPRGTVAQRPTIVTSTTPIRFNTDSTALEYGESVGTWRQLATRAYARSLVSALPTTNIYTADGTLTGNRTLTGSSFWLNLNSNVGIKQATPLQELDVNGDLRVRDSIDLDVTPAHSAIAGLLTRDASGWVGTATLGGGLSYSGGVLSSSVSTGTVTSVGLSLPSIFSVSGSPVTTSGTLSASFTGGTNNLFLRGDGRWMKSLYFNSADSVTFNASGGALIRVDGNDSGFDSKFEVFDYGYLSNTLAVASTDDARYNFDRSRGTITSPTSLLKNDKVGGVYFRAHNGTSYRKAGYFGAIVDSVSGTNISTKLVMGVSRANNAETSSFWRFVVEEFRNISVLDHAIGKNVGIGIAASIDALETTTIEARLHVKGAGTTTGKTMLIEDSGGADILTITDNKTIQAHDYGKQTKEAGDITKTFGNVAAFATDGTMLDYRITRDTSASNADFTVTSTLLSSCQELFISAEVTSVATDTVNVILPTPSATFKNNKVYVFGDDDSSTQWVAVKSANATGLYYSNGGVKPTATNYAAVTATTGVSGVTYVWICTRRNSGTWNWVLIRQ